MSEQLSLFDIPISSPHGYQSPIQCSVAAKESIDINRSQSIVYDAIKEFGPITDEQLIEIAVSKGLSANGIRARRGELLFKGKIKQAGNALTKSGRTATTWEIAK